MNKKSLKNVLLTFAFCLIVVCGGGDEPRWRDQH